MKIILMRHAKAMNRNPHIFKDDSLRPLSEKGEKEHKQISEVLFNMGVTFDHILTSPYERAKKTANITRKVYKIKEKAEKADELADSFSVDNLIKRLSGFARNRTILLVGHEPDMSMLANSLLQSKSPMDIDFKKSGIMSIAFEGMPVQGQGTLEFFLRPSLLRNLEDKKK